MSTETRWVVTVNDGAGWRTKWGPYKKKPDAYDFARALLRAHPNLEPFKHVKVITDIHSKVEDKGWIQ